jgi:hypothetical protein
MSRKLLSLSAALLLGAVGGCATSTDNRVAAAPSPECPASTAAAVTDHRTGPALSNQPSRCVSNDELSNTGHSGNVGAALRQTVPIIQ